MHEQYSLPKIDCKRVDHKSNNIGSGENEIKSNFFNCCGSDHDELNKTKMKNKNCKAVKHCVSSFMVCLGLVSYTFLGAILFVVIEGEGFLNKGRDESDMSTTNFGSEPRERAVENIWEITVNLNILYRENWTKLASQEISKFQEKIIEHLSKEFNQNKDVISSTSDSNWDLARSLLYSITILTTTGYGKMGPKTMLGKTVTMVYAAIGIPLMLIYLSSIGNLLSNCTLSIFNNSFCCGCNRRSKNTKEKNYNKSDTERLNLEPFYIRSPSKTITPDRPSTPRNLNCPDNLHKTSTLTVNHFGNHNSAPLVPISSSSCYKSTFLSISLCLAVMIAYVCCGASILCILERNWSYLDGIFFCFMTLSTINFVDTVPSKLQTYGDMTVWFFCLYILSGMALTAMCFNIFHKEVIYRLETYNTSPILTKNNTIKSPAS